MNKLKFLIIVLVITVSCGKKEQKPVEIKKTNVPVKVESYVFKDSISGYIHSRLGLYNFKFELDTAEIGKLKTIKIYSDSMLIQTIRTTSENNGIITYRLTKRLQSGVSVNLNPIELIDWNFDGYKDISILSSSGTGGSSYNIWNYSPKKNKYVYNSRLSEHLGLEIDSVSKYIVFHYRAGYQQESWDTMQYVNNKLTFVKGLYREIGSEWAYFTRSKMVNGSSITTKDSCLIDNMKQD